MAARDDARPASPARAARVCVGRIAGAHGVRGLVRIASYTEDPMDIAAYRPVTDAAGERSFVIDALNMAKSHVLARIEGVDDRGAAEALRGVELYVPREALPAPGDDEFYWDDLVGLAAETPAGAALGTVRSVQDFGAGVMLEIGKPRSRTTLVPFTREIVPVVDPAGGRVVIDAPDGLFDPPRDDRRDDGKDAENGR